MDVFRKGIYLFPLELFLASERLITTKSKNLTEIGADLQSKRFLL